MEQPTTQQAHCLRCGRLLRSAASVARGYGAHCAAKIRRAAADLTDYQPHQITSARQLIEDAAIIPLRARIFLAVSTDGAQVHRTDARGYCTCPSGLKSGRCYHTAAARMLLAA